MCEIEKKYKDTLLALEPNNDRNWGGTGQTC